MRRTKFIRKMVREPFRLAMVAVASFAIIAFAGLIVSPLTGWVPPGLGPLAVWAQIAPPSDPVVPLASLRGVTIPEPANLGEFVKDREAAVKLGKALFWDMQVGSDGFQACASCHFSSGADNRSRNQLSPGLLGGDTTFNTGGPNFKLEAGDFPFHKLTDPTDRNSEVLSDSNDVVSSQGVALMRFLDIAPGSFRDLGTFMRDDTFNVDGTNTRRVEPRNTPSIINAVFNFDNFWDGRARNIFNGVNPFGARDPDAFVLKAIGPNELQEVQVRLENSALASQAVGPPLSPFEMSFDGRTFPKLGKKMLSLQPLARQQVHLEDSVLGPHSLWPDPGLSTTYEQMIRDAFQPAWWGSELIIEEDDEGNLVFKDRPDGPLTTDEFTLIERNFSLFFGLSIQMYEATLVSDDAPIDRFMDGDRNALTRQQERGLGRFESGKANCSQCHGGPEFTSASVNHASNEILERMNMGNGECAIYDNGFYNIGVRPTDDDLGRGGSDPFGPKSHTRMAQMGLFVDTSPEGAQVLDPTDECDSRAAVDGAFKVPGLRNVELTAPYFHNGGQSTLRQVVEFYNRGGDFSDENIDNLDPDIETLGLDDKEIDELVAFLTSLTDERVRFQRAPFDHPQLFVANGHSSSDGGLEDSFLEISAVGSSGGAPLLKFLEEPLAVSCGVPSDNEPGALVLAWRPHPNPDVLGYNLKRSRVSGGPYETVNSEPLTGTSFRDTGLLSDTTYYYVITAVDGLGNESSDSSQLSGTTL